MNTQWLRGGLCIDRVLQASLVAMAMVGAASCSRQESRAHATDPDSGAPAGQAAYQNPAAIPHPSPPQPVGPQVGRTDALLNAAAPRLREWVEMWGAALPGFRIDSTWSSGREQWAPMDVRKFDSVEGRKESESDVTFEILGLPSPDGRYALDVDSYQYIAPEGDSLEVGGEPDSQPTLIDYHSKVEMILKQCGTSCGFHWGAWLSPTRFALGGWCDADDYGQWKQGFLSIYSLADSTVASYSTRIVSAEDYAWYETAWKAWLTRRYRSVKVARPQT